MVNRAEHAIADSAAMRAGAIPVSFYYTLTEDQLGYVAADCGTKVAFVDEALLPMWKSLRGKLDLATVVVVGAVGEIDGCCTFESLLVRGKELLAQGKAGSGGNLPRAKELGLLDANGEYHYPPGARMVSYLPLAHIAERIFSFYTAQHTAARVRFVRDLTKMAEVLPEVRPLGFLAVPRVWEKLHSAIVTTLQGEEGAKRKLGLRAVEVARAVGVARLEGRSPGLGMKLQHRFFEKAVYSKLREAIGLDQTVLGLTGAAPITKELLGTWLGFGIEISEAFGLTESHAVLAFGAGRIAGRHGRQAAAGDRGAAGRGRGDPRARGQRLQRLPEPARGDRGGARRRLAAHR
jgi:long-chain acyl-CoA synthetase